MKALILAAGRGTRIRSIHGERPKCLIPLDHSNSTILDCQIANLLDAGVSKIVIVVGYQSRQIINHVRSRYYYCADRFEFISNHRYAETNNIYSLWLARDAMRGNGFVCLNADVAFDSQMLAPALAAHTPITMIVDPEWRDETMKVIIQNGRVVRMSKQISRDEFSGTYIGITAFSERVTAAFFQRIDRLVMEGSVSGFFNVAVQELADDGLHVGHSSTEGLPWAEIDDPADLAFARLHVFPKLQSTSAAA